MSPPVAVVRRLSPRELEVARLVAEGLSDKMIAGILRLSRRTVQTHLDRISDKIGAKDLPAPRRFTITVHVRKHEGDNAA